MVFASNDADFASLDGSAPPYGGAGGDAATVPPIGCVHPQRWTEDQVMAWWERRTKKRKGVCPPPRGTDGRNMMRWPISRFEQLCNGNMGMAVSLYQDLRNEIERYEQFRRTGAMTTDIVETQSIAPPLSRTNSARRARPSKPAEVSPSDTSVISHTTNGAVGTEGSGVWKSCGSGARGGGNVSVAGGSAPSERQQRFARVRARTPTPAAPSSMTKDSPCAGASGFQFAPAARCSGQASLVGTLANVSAEAVESAVAETSPRSSVPSRARTGAQRARASTTEAIGGSSVVLKSAKCVHSQITQTLSERATEATRPSSRQRGVDQRVSNRSAEKLSPCAQRWGTKVACGGGVAAAPSGVIVLTESLGDEEEEGRQMFDKRELRKRHKDIFEQHLKSWRKQHLNALPSQRLKTLPGAEASRVRVYVRKRPLFEREAQAGENDVVSVRGHCEVVVHSCLTKADLRSLFVSHMGFPFFRAFGEETLDDEVYEHCAAPVVRHTKQGGVATLFLFGQTGSGKTHTMRGLVKRAAAAFFDKVDVVASENNGLFSLSLDAFEIAGKAMRDLLEFSAAPGGLKIMEDKDRRTQVLGTRVCEVSCAAELLAKIEGAQANRATRATQVNETSSRSHAVFRIWHPSIPGAVLTLVDCAGSERREDTTNHDSQSRKAAAEINSTIFALKECFRVMRAPRSGQQPPFRESLLTRVLADSFVNEQALVAAIGTVSPSSTDTEHSVATLKALQQLQGTQMSFEAREDIVIQQKPVADPHPRGWSEEEVRQWLECAAGVCRGRDVSSALTRGTDGKHLVRWPLQRFTQLCGEEELGNKLYQELRQKIRAAAGGGGA